MPVLKQFPSISKKMQDTAKEKLKYHLFIILKVVDSYNDPEIKEELYAKCMQRQVREKTKFISMKRLAKRKKEPKKAEINDKAQNPTRNFMMRRSSRLEIRQKTYKEDQLK
jgi:hypothetical protein